MTVSIRWCRLLMLALGVLFPGTCHAYRPFDSTDASVVSKGAVEIELGPLGYLAEEGSETLVVPDLVVNLGVLESWEVVVEGRYLIQRDSTTSQGNSLDDAGIFLKGILRRGALQDARGPSVATEIGALLPGSDNEEMLGAECAFILSQRWDMAVLHLNAASSWTRSHSLGLFGGIILEGPTHWTVRPVAEVFAEGERDSPNVISVLAGAIWRLNDDLSLDVGLRRAQAGDTTISEARAGLTVTFRL